MQTNEFFMKVFFCGSIDARVAGCAGQRAVSLIAIASAAIGYRSGVQAIKNPRSQWLLGFVD